ncbi:ribosomal protein S12 methylthiotransferase accessory factor [Nonomuraea maritima]|uniref:Ribosomal protein S12 methylthiotransferase accessory factor n=1 Tax=Nonomuraea maritima TaxID=683260 RepID=A0A1G9HK63_9ACTN|nr:TOMM precursor leader peptide-binding protein [Nonomuraea maritima]SDL13275.1 ribosomal protein S12 methylthiotransferase accessory factor [Nonomuraea maritima]
MDVRPSFRRHHRVETVDGEGVYLVSERDLHVLTGRTVRALAGLLDGKHTVTEILAAVEPEIPPEQVFYVLHQLREQGFLVDVTEAVEPRAAAYWEMAGRSADQAVAGITGAAVEVLAVGDVPHEELAVLLADEGVRVSDGTSADPGLTVVLTDDYIRKELAEINRRHLAEGRPWLLARAGGPVLWLGPIFQPGSGGGCWRCLSQRLEGHRQGLTYLEDRLHSPRPLPMPAAELPLTRGAGLRMIAAETLKWLAGVRNDQQGDVITVDTHVLGATRHELRRRVQCPECGDPSMVAAQTARPVELVSRPKSFTADGGHRSRHPEETAERYGHLVSPVTGVVRELVKQDTGTSFIKTYMAGHNFSRQVHDLRELRTGLRSQSCGKGMTDLQAKVSAMCEAIERYSGIFQGDEARTRASLRALGDDAVHPNACALYSEAQFRDRPTGIRASTYTYVNDPLDESADIDWTPVWSLTEQRHKYLPTGYLYYYYPRVPGRIYAWSDSNGNAAGSSVEDAVLQGFMELVERDAVAVWWYNRLRRPAFDLEAFRDPWIAEFLEVYAGLNREVHVLDLTNDLGIPVAAAISRRTTGPTEDILMAFGAHFDPRIAVQRALAEMNQFIPAVIQVTEKGTRYRYPDGEQLRWWKTARIEQHPYLTPSGSPVPPSAHSRPPTGDLLDDIATARAVVEDRGMEMLVLDQTRPDIGLPVVKVIVPGLRHFWRRLAPGRLYDVPVRLGWLAEPTAEDQMNPITMFL